MRVRQVRVLLVTGDASLQRRAREAFATAGAVQFHLEQADALSRALAKIDEAAPDVVLLDLEGETEGGFAALRGVREKAPDVPIVVLAPDSGEEFQGYLIQEGAQDCLPRSAAGPADLRRALLFAVDRRVPDSLKLHRMREFKTGEARFWELLAGYPEGVALLSKNGTVRLINAAACRMLGRESPELVGRPFPFPLAASERKVVHVVRGEADVAVIEIRRIETEWEWETAAVAALRDITEPMRAEERLRSSEERYRLATRATSDAVYDWNMLTNELTWSEAFGWLFGYPFSEIAGNTDWWLERVHADDRARLAALMYELHKGEKTSFEVEYRLRRRDGSFASVMDRGQVVRDGAGRPCRTVGAVADITERKLAEQELRAREARLKEAQALAQAGSWQWDLATSKITWSDELYRIYGVERSSFVPTFENIRAFTHPEDIERGNQAIKQAIEECGTFQFVYRITRAGGGTRVLYARGAAMPGEGGKPGRIAGVAQDITERWEAEEALRESESRRAEAQTVAGLGTWEWDIATNHVTASQELLRLIGAEENGLAPTLESYLGRVLPEDGPLARRVLEEAYAKKRPFEAECRIVRMDGEARRIFTRADFVLGPTGAPLRMVGIALDITDRYPGGPEAARAAPAREFVPAPREALRVRQS